MKYLKLFESAESKDYVKMDQSDVMEFLSDHMIMDMPIEEENEIRDVLGGEFGVYSRFARNSHTNFKYPNGRNDILGSKIVGKFTYIDNSGCYELTNEVWITYHEDDYYLARYLTMEMYTQRPIETYYKCDQSKGLMDFIKYYKIDSQTKRVRNQPSYTTVLVPRVRESLESEKYYEPLEVGKILSFFSDHDIIDITPDQARKVKSLLGKYFNVYDTNNYSKPSTHYSRGGNTGLKITPFQRSIIDVKNRKIRPASPDESDGFEVIVGCHEDEYYLVKYSYYVDNQYLSDFSPKKRLEQKYYLCDQFEGLLKFLQDLKDKKLPGQKVDKITESLDGDLYQRMESDDFKKFDNNKRKSFTSQEIKEVESIFPKWFEPGEGRGSKYRVFVGGVSGQNFQPNNSRLIEDDSSLMISRNDNRIVFNIYIDSYVDEYYRVSVVYKYYGGNRGGVIYRYYICDQFDGLLKFLRDIESGKLTPASDSRINFFNQ